MIGKTTPYFFVFFGMILAVLVYRYYDYNIQRHYILEVNTVCDPAQEQCFIAAGSDYEDVYNSEPYKKVTIRADYAPECLEEHSCSAFTCEGVAGACVITYCDEETHDETETCVVEVADETTPQP